MSHGSSRKEKGEMVRLHHLLPKAARHASSRLFASSDETAIPAVSAQLFLLRFLAFHHSPLGVRSRRVSLSEFGSDT